MSEEKKYNVENISINTDNLSKGVYLMVITQNNKSITKKIII